MSSRIASGFAAGWYDEQGSRETLRRLFANSELRKRMGRIARTQVAENYSTDRVLDAVSDCLPA